MLENASRLVSIVDNKVAHLYLDNDTPLHVVKEMLIEFVTYVGNVEAEIKAKQEAQKQMEAPEAVPEAVPEADPVIEAASEPIEIIEQPKQAE